MGMAASQARLLSLTSRLADNELRAQLVNNNKMRLATASSKASAAYVNALNNATMMITNYDAQGNSMYTPLTFNSLTRYSQYNNQYGLADVNGNLLVSESEANLFKQAGGVLDDYLRLHGFEKTTTYFDTNLFDFADEDKTAIYIGNKTKSYPLEQIKAMFFGGEYDGVTYRSYDQAVENGTYSEYKTYKNAIIDTAETLERYSKMCTAAIGIVCDANIFTSSTTNDGSNTADQITNDIKAVKKLLDDYVLDSITPANDKRVFSANTVLKRTENVDGTYDNYTIADLYADLDRLLPRNNMRNSNNLFTDEIDENGQYFLAYHYNNQDSNMIIDAYTYPGSHGWNNGGTLFSDEDSDLSFLPSRGNHSDVSIPVSWALAYDGQEVPSELGLEYKVTLHCYSSLESIGEGEKPLYKGTTYPNYSIYPYSDDDPSPAAYSNENNEFYMYEIEDPYEKLTEEQWEALGGLKAVYIEHDYTVFMDYSDTTCNNKLGLYIEVPQGAKMYTYKQIIEDGTVYYVPDYDYECCPYPEDSGYGSLINQFKSDSYTFVDGDGKEMNYLQFNISDDIFNVERFQGYNGTLSDLMYFYDRTGSCVAVEDYAGNVWDGEGNSVDLENINAGDYILAKNPVFQFSYSSTYGIKVRAMNDRNEMTEQHSQDGTRTWYTLPMMIGGNEEYTPEPGATGHDVRYEYSPFPTNTEPLTYELSSRLFDGKPYYLQICCDSQLYYGDYKVTYDEVSDSFQYTDDSVTYTVPDDELDQLVEMPDTTSFSISFVNDYAVKTNEEIYETVREKCQELLALLAENLNNVEYGRAADYVQASSDSVMSDAGTAAFNKYKQARNNLIKLLFDIDCSQSFTSPSNNYLLKQYLMAHAGNLTDVAWIVSDDNYVGAYVAADSNNDNQYDYVYATKNGQRMLLRDFLQIDIDGDEFKQLGLLDQLFETYGSPVYAWFDINNPTENADAKVQWYINLFNRMSEGYKALEDGLASSNEWMEFALESGLVSMEQVDLNYSWKTTLYSNVCEITEVTDDAAVARAEAEYNKAMSNIEAKDKRLDIELKNIDTEHNALQTEYEQIKNVISKNIERSFKIYS